MHRDRIHTARHPRISPLVLRAIAAGTPEPVAAEALRVTRTRFPGRGASDGALSARSEAYFWGVIRRRALEGAAPAIGRRLVIASLERELEEAGHPPEAIRREVARLYGAESCAAVGMVGTHSFA